MLCIPFTSHMIASQAALVINVYIEGGVTPIWQCPFLSSIAKVQSQPVSPITSQNASVGTEWGHLGHNCVWGYLRLAFNQPLSAVYMPTLLPLVVKIEKHASIQKGECLPHSNLERNTPSTLYKALIIC